MNNQLDKLAKTVCNRLQHYRLKGRTITLKIKYSDFKQVTRSKSFAEPLDDFDTISSTSKSLLGATDLKDKKIRLLGINISNFGSSNTSENKHSNQLELF